MRSPVSVVSLPRVPSSLVDQTAIGIGVVVQEPPKPPRKARQAALSLEAPGSPVRGAAFRINDLEGVARRCIIGLQDLSCLTPRCGQAASALSRILLDLGLTFSYIDGDRSTGGPPVLSIQGLTGGPPMPRLLASTPGDPVLRAATRSGVKKGFANPEVIMSQMDRRTFVQGSVGLSLGAWDANCGSTRKRTATGTTRRRTSSFRATIASRTCCRKLSGTAERFELEYSL